MLTKRSLLRNLVSSEIKCNQKTQPRLKSCQRNDSIIDFEKGSTSELRERQSSVAFSSSSPSPSFVQLASSILSAAEGDRSTVLPVFDETQHLVIYLNILNASMESSEVGLWQTMHFASATPCNNTMPIGFNSENLIPSYLSTSLNPRCATLICANNSSESKEARSIVPITWSPFSRFESQSLD